MWKHDRREPRPATAATRASSARRAARTSSSRTRRPTCDALVVALAARRVRVPGPEVLGREPRVRAEEPVAARARAARGASSPSVKMGDVARLPQLHGRGDRQGRLRHDHGLHRAREGARPTRRSSSAASATTATGWFIAADGDRAHRPAVHARWWRRSSARCSRCTSTTTRAEAETLDLCDTTSPYALTGAVFAEDRARRAAHAPTALRHAAGNFYVNDKPTGAVVGQQPFGGARASGTNDKAGSVLNLLRWVSARTIKENLVPPTDWRYRFLGEA